jgi:hypothetical protein
MGTEGSRGRTVAVLLIQVSKQEKAAHFPNSTGAFSKRV